MLLPLLLFASCSDEADFNISKASSLKPAVEMTSSMTLQLSTDKALYAPGQTVSFTVSGSLPSGATVRYRHGNDVISEEPLQGSSWTWTAPSEDFTGYLVDIYTHSGSGETIYGTIAVDVSSDWSRYPRYGFVATYDKTKTQDVISQEMAALNRYHINGVQFYDWHYAHHQPYTPEPVYTDIANREIDADVVSHARHFLPWAVLIPLCGMAAFVWDGICIGLTRSRAMLAACLVAATAFFALWLALRTSLANHALWLALLVYLVLRGLVLAALYSRRTP